MSFCVRGKKMILIAHRGNVLGKNPSSENNPLYIEEALTLGYDVEIDVWYDSGDLYLGHDSPQYKVDEEYFQKKGLWCHAKNVMAIHSLLNINAHCFWHQQDDITLTSKGVVWTFPDKKLIPGSVAVMPENSSYTSTDLEVCSGICSDFIRNYKK